jgi:hypothetical protein
MKKLPSAAALLVVVLYASAPSNAAIGHGHVLVQPLMESFQARDAVRRDLPKAQMIAAAFVSGKPVSPAQALMLSLVAHRGEIPPGELSEVLGPGAAKALGSVELDADTLDSLRESLNVSAVYEKLANVFDNDRATAKADAFAYPASPVAAAAPSSVHHPSTLDPATPFLSHGRFHPKEGEGLPDAILEKGTVRDRPAVRLTLADHMTYVAVQMGTAKTWDEARAAARAMGPSWDLPTTDDYFPLVASTALDVRHVIGRTSWPDAPADQAIYPLWTRFAGEADNARFKGGALLYTMRDGSGMDGGIIDIAAKTLGEAKRALVGIRRKLAAGEHRTADEEKRLSQALADHRQRTGSSLNPEIAHGELPADVNAIIAKPSRETLENRAAALSRSLDAFANGYPVYAVQKTGGR